MSASKNPPEADRPRAVDTDSTHLPGTFLGHVLNSHSDRLYDLMEDIPDVMGLQALRPSAVVCKVMTVPNSRCVRVVTPDEHVNTGFHEVLIHDMAREDWPLVTLSDIGCLRLDWPKALFTFMGRYQFELEQMRKVCRERSGTCPTCCLVPSRSCAIMALPGFLVYGLEGDFTRLCGSHEKGARYSRFREGGEFGTLVSAVDSDS